MGLGGISIWQLVIILVIVLLIFGTKRLKGLGGDLGGAIKGFKEAVSNEDDDAADGEASTQNKTDDTVQTNQNAEQDADGSSDKSA